MPEREGYVNDVIVEGKIFTEGGILQKIGTKKHKEGELKSFLMILSSSVVEAKNFCFLLFSKQL